jgi:hypothetical protein
MQEERYHTLPCYSENNFILAVDYPIAATRIGRSKYQQRHVRRYQILLGNGGYVRAVRTPI